VALQVAETATEATGQDSTALAKELRKKHPEYVDHRDEWLFFSNSYDGGRDYLQAGYLYKHPNEQGDGFVHRQNIACYYNFCQEVVDLYVSYLFQKPGEIDYGDLGNDQLFKTFKDDADLKGNTFRSFLRESQRKASTYGHVAIIVDKPRPAEDDAVPETQQQEQDQNIRPYVYRVNPTNIVDWTYQLVGTSGYRLTMIRIVENDDPERYRIWYEDRWELWEVEKDKAVLLDSGENPIGQVPVVFLLNLATDADLIGRSDLNDIAYVNRHIYNLCSWNDENIENTCFAMLAKAKREAGKGGEGGSDDVGPSIVIEYDPGEPNDKPYWLEPPGVSQDVFDKRIDRDVDEIHRMAKMGGVSATPTEAGKSPKSGVALELEFRQMNSTLAEKADNVEEAHQAIIDLYVKWQGGGEFKGTIDYPDDFNIEDLAADLENAIQATALRISARFNAEMKKKISRIALPKLDPEAAKEIDDQIEAQALLFIPAEFSLLLQNNLSNPVEVMMALRGIDEKEARRILEENKKLNDEFQIAGPSPPDMSGIFGAEEGEGGTEE